MTPKNFVTTFNEILADLSDKELNERHEQLNGILRASFAPGLMKTRDELERERMLIESEMVRRFKAYTPELTDPFEFLELHPAPRIGIDFAPGAPWVSAPVQVIPGILHNRDMLRALIVSWGEFTDGRFTYGGRIPRVAEKGITDNLLWVRNNVTGETTRGLTLEDIQKILEKGGTPGEK